MGEEVAALLLAGAVNTEAVDNVDGEGTSRGEADMIADGGFVMPSGEQEDIVIVFSGPSWRIESSVFGLRRSVEPLLTVELMERVGTGGATVGADGPSG